MRTLEIPGSIGDTRAGSPPAVLQVGFWSAVLTTVWTIAADLAMAGGPLGLPVGMAPFATSLMIAPFFLALVISIHRSAAEPRKIWTQIATACATIYAGVVSVNYLLQLTILRVRPDPQLTLPGAPDSAGFMLEIVGYSWMVLAGLCLVPVFEKRGGQRWIRWLLIGNAVGALVALLTYLFTANGMHVLILVDLGLWGISWPVAMALIAVWFRHSAASPG